MKKLFLLVSIILFSQLMHSQESTTSFDDLWKKVQQFENEDLTKSALKVVGFISDKAKKEKNSSQLVKALLYSSKYALILEEDAQLHIIKEFNTEIEKAAFPTKNILESYLANLYWQYFQQNRYQFYNRTRTAQKVDSVDFRTWDLTTLFHEVSIHFDASLHHNDGLKKVASADFNELLHTQKDAEKYRPTLFDLLAHTALDFYKTSENTITRPADKFEIDNPELLCEGYQFIVQKIAQDDPTSLQSKALQIYQDLLQFHAHDESLAAYVTVDIERLQFIKDNALFDQKSAYYLNVLKNSAEHIKEDEHWGLYEFEIAQHYQELGNTYQPNSNIEHRWKLKEALDLCETIINAYPESVGASKSKNLKSLILQKNIQLTNELYIPIAQPSRLLVNYKNIAAITLTAYKIKQDQLEDLEKLYQEEEKIKFIQQLKSYKTWNATLKIEDDYQNHSIEVLVPALENGQYLLVATTNENDKESFAYSHIQATNLAVAENQTDDSHTFQVIDRTNGMPISGAQVALTYRINYDKKYLTKIFTSDKNGQVNIRKSLQNWTEINAKIAVNKETAYFGDYYINRDYTSSINDNTTYSCFLFTDRSIYRPGQALYFKGIAISKAKEGPSVLPNTLVQVALYDVNSQEVGQQSLKTNAFGSFNGEFILPSNGLTGNFSLIVSSKAVNLNGETYVSVEEYKRPKFEASFTPVTETYKVNDTITVAGKAMAYAGSTITDAKVSYRVKRVVYFPRWYYWHRPYLNSTPQEISHGETHTDGSGNFKIDFKAIPDTSTSADQLPTFSYDVTADITDINGETHSTTTIVNVGYHALTASLNIEDIINKNSKENKLTISTNNLNGQFVPSKGTLKIYKLKAPDHVLRPRPWSAPDYDYFGKTKFKELFPNDAFDKEHNPNTWEKSELVLETTFDTGKSNEVTLPNLKKWISGAYRIELETKDKFGQIVQDKIQFNLFSEAEKILADHQLFSISTDKSSYTVDDNVKITLRSAAQDLNITVSIEKNHKIIDTKIIHLTEDSEMITIPVKKEDLGGFVVNYSYSAFNSFASGSLPIAVPYPVTDLQIETVTFRDKLQPGTDETWTFKIKGAKGDKVAAELLASMYDASLDAFQNHSWSFKPLYKQSYYSYRYSNANHSYGINAFRTHWNFDDGYSYVPQHYDTWNWFGFHFGYGGDSFYGTQRMAQKSGSLPTTSLNDTVGMVADSEALEEVAIVGDVNSTAAPQAPGTNNPEDKASHTDFTEVQIRTNLQETAFFFPQLQTDKDGNVSFSFTTPEALTKWKLQLLAHTKNLESAISTLQTVTQKELMVLPNVPRFLREGDQIVISTKIANLSGKSLTGQAKLVLTDAVAHTDITTTLTSEAQKAFSVAPDGNTQVAWTLTIPKGLQAVQYQILAKAGDFSDGEQNILPVLSNRMLVTETLPMWVRSNQTKTFSLDKLKYNASKTLSNHKLTLEITSNPAWYAVQALPYLMEYPYECNEQTFSRYYANALASHIANSDPTIEAVFKQWATTDALLSNLEKNKELKSLLIQETPWLRDAQSETEQKKRIALLFNMNKMKSEQESALQKLQQNQMSSGAWAWFAGGKENRFITQHIITGLGHLRKLTSASLNDQNSGAEGMIENAISYLDQAFIKEYEYMKKHTTNLNGDHLSQTQVHYLYMRSFFKEIKTSKKLDEIILYYKGQAQKYWKDKTLYTKGMLGLILNRMDDTKSANSIIRSLKEKSITSDELGMYWKENTSSWYWYQAPIETQALLIEAFSEIQNDVVTIDNLKIWLLKHKQTNQWNTTKATTEAVYALLLQGSDWISVTDAVEVLVGGDKISPSKLEDVKVEAGTGYYKTSWNSTEISPKMADVQLTKKGNGIAWGAMYWQYFEDLDKITSAETPLKLNKKLFLKTNTATGEEISEITSKSNLKVGDLVRIRIELRADRDMEFIHMKDMRAAGFEPINVLSSYKWQDGLGYYESTKDASTNFFFDYLPKGVYVFEYDVRINNAGDFSNGITTIQSMYAPEFNSHSEGIRVNIK